MEPPITLLDMKRFVIEALALEDIGPEDIGDDAPLFGGDLALDSIDALELGLALQKRFRVPLDGDERANREHFRSIQSLVEFVNKARPAQASTPMESAS